MRRPYKWEALYPPGIHWDTPIERGTLPELLDRAVAQFGTAPAIEFRERSLSFQELGERVDRFAAGLLGLGLRPGDAVALYLPNTPWHPIAFFGVLRAGMRVVHLSPLDPPRALARKLADSGASTVVTTNVPRMMASALRLLRENAAVRLIVGEDAEWGPGEAEDMPAEPNVLPVSRLSGSPPPAWPSLAPDDIALLQYTGGTTGEPRAAMLTHGNLTAAVSIIDAWQPGERNLRPGDRVIGVLPLFHIYALTSVLLRPLHRGAEILLRQRFDPIATLHDIETKRATAFPGVPTMWIALASVPGLETRDLSSLRSTTSGGAPLPVEMSDRFHRLTGVRLGGGWGMTETSPVGAHLLSERPYRSGEIGVPLPGIIMQVVALDDPARELPCGEIGEIRIKGPNVTPGYWKRPDENARAFVDGFFLTGDVGSMDETGYFTLVDRKKDMIISGGFNVYPRIIEEAIYEHPDVAEAAVIGIPHAYRGQAAKAFVALRPGADELTLEGLRIFLVERLGRHEIPTELELRDSLPKTPVGKLSRHALAAEKDLSPWT